MEGLEAKIYNRILPKRYKTFYSNITVPVEEATARERVTTILQRLDFQVLEIAESEHRMQFQRGRLEETFQSANLKAMQTFAEITLYPRSSTHTRVEAEFRVNVTGHLVLTKEARFWQAEVAAFERYLQHSDADLESLKRVQNAAESQNKVILVLIIVYVLLLSVGLLKLTDTTEVTFLGCVGGFMLFAVAGFGVPNLVIVFLRRLSLL